MADVSLRLNPITQLKLEKNLPEIIAITSGKGGVGKTFISVNLAICLAQLKKRVLLLDADIHLGNVDLFLGIRPAYNIADVVRGEKSIEEVIFKGPVDIDFLPASSGIKDLIVNEPALLHKYNQAFRQVEPNYDTIVIDTGAGISRAVLSFVLSADKIVVVVTPDPASITDAYSVIKIVSQINIEIPIVLMINFAHDEEEGYALYNKLNLMTERFLQRKIIYGGAIIESATVAQSVKKQMPLLLHQPNSAPTHTLRNLVRKLYRIPVAETPKRGGLFTRLMTNQEYDFCADTEEDNL